MNLSLIDEFRLCIHPVVAGSGLPLFENRNDTTIFKLVKTKTFDARAVVLYYEPGIDDNEVNDPPTTGMIATQATGQDQKGYLVSAGASGANSDEGRSEPVRPEEQQNFSLSCIANCSNDVVRIRWHYSRSI